jgi:hypothetical protein
VPRKRIATHKSNKWEILDLFGPREGLKIMELEAKWLAYLREINAQQGIENVAGKFDGYSESWFEDKLSIRSINQIIKILDNNESGGFKI